MARELFASVNTDTDKQTTTPIHMQAPSTEHHLEHADNIQLWLYVVRTHTYPGHPQWMSGLWCINHCTCGTTILTQPLMVMLHNVVTILPVLPS